VRNRSSEASGERQPRPKRCLLPVEARGDPYTARPHRLCRAVEGRGRGHACVSGCVLAPRRQRRDGILGSERAISSLTQPSRPELFYRIMDFALTDWPKRGSAHSELECKSCHLCTSLRSGWRLVAPYATWARQTAPRAPCQRWRTAHPSLAASLAFRRFFRLRWRCVPDSRRSTRRGRTTQAARFLTSNASLGRKPMENWSKGWARRSSSHVRDAAYYRWRYRNPLCRLRFLFWTGVPLEGSSFCSGARPRRCCDIRIIEWEARDLKSWRRCFPGCRSRRLRQCFDLDRTLPQA